MLEFIKSLDIAEDIKNQLTEKFNSFKIESDKNLDLEKEENKKLKTLLESDEYKNIAQIKASYTQTQQELKEAQEKHKLEIIALKKDNAINEVLMKNNAINIKAVLPFINKDAITVTDDGILGLNEQIENIKNAEDTKFLFEQPKENVINNGYNLKPANSNNQPTQTWGKNGFDPNNIPSFEVFGQSYQG